MNAKKAAAHEELERKVEIYTKVIKGMIQQATLQPLEYDYSEELEKLYKAHPGDRGAIHRAEIEAYKR